MRTPVGNSGIDWKVGVWDTIIGYESSSDPLNPNYTRSYGYGIEPTTHTGILATYKINDIATVEAGVADSAYGAINATSSTESQKAYMAAVALTAPESTGWLKGATLNFGIIDNPTSGSAAGTTSLYAGMTLPTPITALKVGWAFDYSDIHNHTKANGSDDSTWVGGLYANYQFNEKLSFNTRAEYVSIDGASFIPYDGTAAAPFHGRANTAEEFTATVQYNFGPTYSAVRNSVGIMLNTESLRLHPGVGTPARATTSCWR